MILIMNSENDEKFCEIIAATILYIERNYSDYLGQYPEFNEKNFVNSLMFAFRSICFCECRYEIKPIPLKDDL